MNFTEFSLDQRLLEGIGAMNYETATPIQEQAIPAIIEGKDILASAQTGTGKTAAFLLPVIHKLLNAKHDDHIRALVIVPTRELAIQITQQMEGLSYFTNLSSIAVYGGGDGSSFATEKQALVEGADVVICTPGRMITHLSLGYVNLSSLKFLILDEADRMLDMGFFDDIMKMISYLPGKRQNLLFCATMPGKIRELARKILYHPVEINIALSKPPEKIKQEAFILYDTQKAPLVKYLLLQKQLRSVLIFCSTKLNAKLLGRELKKSGLAAEDIHSDLDQETREKVLMSFRNRKLNILVATDVLSRGIDVEDIDLVINFDVPHDAEDYVHRIGRTARAESEGEAITFVALKEQEKFLRIEEMLGKPVIKAVLPEHLGDAPAYNPRKSSFGHNRSKGGKNWSRKKQPGYPPKART